MIWFLLILWMYVDTKEVSKRPGKVVRARAFVRKRTNQCAAVMVSSTPTSVTCTAATAVLVSPRMRHFIPSLFYFPVPNSLVYIFLSELEDCIMRHVIPASLRISAHSTGLKPRVPKSENQGVQQSLTYSSSSFSVSSNAAVLLFSMECWKITFVVKNGSPGKRTALNIWIGELKRRYERGSNGRDEGNQRENSIPWLNEIVCALTLMLCALR